MYVVTLCPHMHVHCIGFRHKPGTCSVHLRVSQGGVDLLLLGCKHEGGDQLTRIGAERGDDERQVESCVGSTENKKYQVRVTQWNGLCTAVQTGTPISMCCHRRISKHRTIKSPRSTIHHIPIIFPVRICLHHYIGCQTERERLSERERERILPSLSCKVHFVNPMKSFFTQTPREKERERERRSANV